MATILSMLPNRAPRWLASALLISTCALGLAACNTVQGVGKDVQSAGEAVEDTSEEVQNRL